MDDTQARRSCTGFVGEAGTGKTHTARELLDSDSVADGLAVLLSSLAPAILCLEDIHEVSSEQLKWVLALARPRTIAVSGSTQAAVTYAQEPGSAALWLDMDFFNGDPLVG
ncbi:MAG: ATP-binding protein [Thermaceae bacterium]|nr:ATP-binding protein [Thermaceae bacterium]